MTLGRATLAPVARAAGLALLAAWGVSAPGCDEAPVVRAVASPSGGGGGAATSSQTAAAVTSSTGPSPCTPEPNPEVVPDGWVEWTDWSCSCRMYIPGARAVLPPLAWGPCPEAPPAIACEALDPGWLDGLPASFYSGQPGPGVDVDAQGKATLLLHRGVPDHYTIFVVADAEGPVHTAIMRAYPGVTGQTHTGCTLWGEDINEGHYVVQVNGKIAWHEDETRDTGAIGGPFSELAPRLIHQDPDDIDNSWRCGENWLARMTPDFTFTAHPWDMSREWFMTSPATDPDGYKAHQAVISGDAIFFGVASLYGGGIMVWNPLSGTRPFVRWPGDFTRMALNLATDGIDLVWSEGEGKAPSAIEFPIRRIMTAPFTSNPAALAPRRLRSQPNQVGSVWPWVVGCGYGAFENNAQIIVVRLSDGWMWSVPNIQPNKPFQRPVGVTCDHVILRAGYATFSTLARVRIDSLGPGLPPD